MSYQHKKHHEIWFRIVGFSGEHSKIHTYFWSYALCVIIFFRYRRSSVDLSSAYCIYHCHIFSVGVPTVFSTAGHWSPVKEDTETTLLLLYTCNDVRPEGDTCARDRNPDDVFFLFFSFCSWRDIFVLLLLFSIKFKFTTIYIYI